MFYNVLTRNPISHEHLLFLFSRIAALFFWDKLCQSPSDPSTWGLTIIELCLQDHSNWPMIEHMTQAGPIIVLPWELFFYLGKKREQEAGKEERFFFSFYLSLCGVATRLGTPAYQRSFPIPWSNPATEENEFNSRRETGWEVGESWELLNPWFQELNSQKFCLLNSQGLTVKFLFCSDSCLSLLSKIFLASASFSCFY